MKKIFVIFIFFIFYFSNSIANEIKFEKILGNLNQPWSLSFIDEKNILFTEKSGKLYYYNLNSKKKIEINHNLSVLEIGQGGLLDVLYHNKDVYVSYSENRGNWRSSTSVGKGKFNINNINFKNIFRAEPPIDSGYHFGSRLVISEQYLFITSGERGQGMIAQDATKHPGSIIRINLDGSVPNDNPKFTNKKKWLPEIFQIGVRNPQGIALSPYDNKIYLSNHGAKGGDWFGRVIAGGNYGWNNLYWGGTKYSGLKGGPKWLPGYDKPIKYYVPSIAISACLIYSGKEFPEWQGDALIASLKDQSIRKLTFKKNKFTKEEIILKNQIGRIRDIKEDSNGRILILTDKGGLWILSKD